MIDCSKEVAARPGLPELPTTNKTCCDNPYKCDSNGKIHTISYLRIAY